MMRQCRVIVRKRALYLFWVVLYIRLSILILMTPYLSYKFEDSASSVSTFDELPLWSAYFGILLLKHLEPKPNLTILDIGSGAGFPVMEIAGRFGASCTCYGLDLWKNANERANQKINNYGLGNVKIIEGSAEAIPFENESIDLIVSNLGINNFENPQQAFNECYRVLKRGGELALTTNLNGHWQKFYDVFEDTLRELNMEEIIIKLKKQQEHRGSVNSISNQFYNSGFKVNRYYEEGFDMKFADGSAFLNHYFVKLGWLQSWKGLTAGQAMEGIFSLLEQKLNAYAAKAGQLTLSVPMAFVEGVKAG